MDEFDDIPESLIEEKKQVPVNVGFLQSLLRPQTVEIRAEVAHSAAIKFLGMLRDEFPEEDEYRRIMANFLRSIKDNDFGKFRRSIRKAQKDRENPESP